MLLASRLRTGVFIIVAAAVSACASLRTPVPLHAGESPPPYPYSRLIVGAAWNFTTVASLRKAHGSDLWPCTWAADDNLYCAWGDGGGFDGDDDQIGRVSLGFARITGIPAIGNAAAFAGKNVWGQVPYAEVQANFGGKVDSLIAVDGNLYADGGLWISGNSASPVHQSGRGPLDALIRSSDRGKSWTIITQSPALARGTFVNFGRDDTQAIDAYVYSYYVRASDPYRLFLKRIRKDRLTSSSLNATDVHYYSGWRRGERSIVWSSNESSAVPTFYDVRGVLTPSVTYDAPLKRFLLAVGHLAGSAVDGAGPGQIGLFESVHPWGPWATIGYYDHWHDLEPVPNGDFLGMQLPLKWISNDGRALWAIFSGTGSYDSFNLAHAVLTLRRHWWWGDE
jgi:hypothetical protein